MKCCSSTIGVPTGLPNRRVTLARLEDLLAVRRSGVVVFALIDIDHTREFSDTLWEAGSAMLLLFGAANRDPRRYTDPDKFNIHRDNISHITFGKGVHYCLGANLARLEGRVALDEILNRWPEWDIDYDTAQLASTSTVRGWERLRIVLP